MSKRHWWLTYIEGEGMYCLVCKKHRCKSLQNKSDKFSEQPGVRFRTDSVDSHQKFASHIAAIQSDLLQRVSIFHREHELRKSAKQEVLQAILRKRSMICSVTKNTGCSIRLDNLQMKKKNFARDKECPVRDRKCHM